MSIEQVSAGIDEVKLILTEGVPYPEVVDGLGKLTVVGVTEVQASVQDAIERVKEQTTGTTLIAGAASAGFNRFTTIVDEDSDKVEQALTQMEGMETKATETREHMGVMQTKLEQAAGHLADFQEAMGEYEEARTGAVGSIQQSHQEQVASIETLNEYQQAITAGA